MKVARRPPASDVPDPMGSLIALDPRWGEIETWGTMKRAIGPWTDFYLLAAVDLKRDATGAIAKVPEERAVFMTVFVRTFWISLIVAFFCAALGYPVAYLLASQPPAVTNLLLILVLLPFWTSVMVRTAAWVVLLQSEGLVNQVLAWVGFINEPLKLIYNRIGVVIAMVHVLLPFMVLPLYSVMKGISGNTMRAAVSLGAHPFVAFARVYFPQTLPGVMAGTLLVFISSIGYYITPAIVGGADDQMISFFIAFYTNQTLNWGLAAALGTALLGATLLLYFVYARLAGGAKPQLG
jgi:putative spermidine/putrescine transport system permease protein